jgi:hypothetical protein
MDSWQGVVLQLGGLGMGPTTLAIKKGLKKGYQPRTNLVKDENGDLLEIPATFSQLSNQVHLRMESAPCPPYTFSHLLFRASLTPVLVSYWFACGANVCWQFHFVLQTSQ